MPPMILTGPMVIWSQEGGHASPCLLIDQEDVTEWAARLVGQDKVDKGSDAIRGIWRLTLERIR